MEDVKLGEPQVCPACKALNPAGLYLPFECLECAKIPKEKTASGSKVPCSAGLCTLRPNGEPHPAMISIYVYADEIEDKEPERADSICSLAMQLEEKLWKMAVGA